MGNSAELHRIGYLGPEGTFTHQALDRLPGDGRPRAIPLATVADVIRAVESGRVGAGVVPIENSVEGAVTATLDGLAFGQGGVRIAAEVLLPIHFDLFAARGVGRARLRKVLSHPHAFAQCRKFIHSRKLETHSALSTAEACQTLRDHPLPGVGAIASSKAGALYGLVAVKRGIEDVSDAVTRFVLLAKRTPSPTGWDKTSLLLTPRHDRPGSLVELLQEFSCRCINLSRIESRPLKTRLGRYCFFIDAHGHIDDAVLSDAVRSLSRKDVDVKFLGSYSNAAAKPSSHDRSAAHGRKLASGKKLKPIRSVGVCGLGLIGGSLASALQSLGDIKVRGYDIDPKTRRNAISSGIECVSTLPQLIFGSDLIVVATPIETTERIFSDLSPHLKRSQIVTDVGSVKAPVLNAAKRLLPAGVPFVGGHPMAGSEQSGFRASRPDLFQGSSWVLIFDENADRSAYIRLSDLIVRLGARVFALRADAHDSAVSLISHLPHVIAYSLMAYVADSREPSTHRALAAGSFRDLVRVSGAAPQIWTEICRLNAEQVHQSLKGYVRCLSEIEQIFCAGDFGRLRAHFEKGHSGYRRILATARGSPRLESP